MNENARRWVEALRGGEYEQTRGTIRDSFGFCCLGVACDLYVKDHDDLRWGAVTNAGYVPIESEDEGAEDAELPGAVRAWLGLRTTAGKYDDDAQMALSKDNDGYKSMGEYPSVAKKTFAQIADIVESEPAGLFS